MKTIMATNVSYYNGSQSNFNLMKDLAAKWKN